MRLKVSSLIRETKDVPWDSDVSSTSSSNLRLLLVKVNGMIHPTRVSYVA